jgi:16S rRNA (cytidine1402-2'-O)-methyltransferase
MALTPPVRQPTLPAMQLVITARGHPDIKASDTRTLELLETPDMAKRGSVVAIDATYDPAALAALRGRIRVTIAAGGAADSFEATVWPLVHQRHALVFARDPAVKPRVFAGMASKAAADLAPDLKDALRSAAALTITLTPFADAVLPAGTLYLVAMPIGHQGDLSPRAVDVLSGVDLILAEDTRIAHDALAWRGIRTPMTSCFDHNERLRVDLVTAQLAEGRRIALVSDAGMPLVSDPGHLVVRAAIETGANVTTVPGPSAALAALAVSGLPSATFRFAGFPPRKGGKRDEFLEGILAATDTSILFEAPQRIAELVGELAARAPTRAMALARDLTKMTEQVQRGTAAEIAAALAAEPDIRGEFVLVVAPAPPRDAQGTTADLESLVAALLRAGSPTAPVVAALRETSGLSRNEAYALVQRLKPESS